MANARLPDGLTPREHRIARLLALGLEPKEIASRLLMSPQTVKFTARRENVKEHVATLVGQWDQMVADELREAEAIAATRMRQALDATKEDPEDWDTIRSAAKDLLDRAGERGAPKQRVDSRQVIAHLRGPELTRAIATALADPGVPKELKLEAQLALPTPEPLTLELDEQASGQETSEPA